MNYMGTTLPSCPQRTRVAFTEECVCIQLSQVKLDSSARCLMRRPVGLWLVPTLLIATGLSPGTQSHKHHLRCCCYVTAKYDKTPFSLLKPEVSRGGAIAIRKCVAKPVWLSG